MQEKIHWHILGAGAIGSLWACYAYQNAVPATLILRSDSRLQAYRQAGGIMAKLGALALQLPVPVTSPSSITKPIEHILITTKAQQTLAAITAIEHQLAEKVVIVLLQNGLGIAEMLSQRYPQATLLQASTTEGAYRQSLFSLVHAGRGNTQLGQSKTLLAETQQTPLDHDELANIAMSLSLGPLGMTVNDNIDDVLWQKLAVNCAINPLTVKYRCRNGELLDNPVALAELEAVVAEIAQFDASPEYPDLLATVRHVAANTALNRSSMLQDIEAGRPTEIAFISGYLCQLAEQHRIPVPMNRQLLDEIKRLSAANQH